MSSPQYQFRRMYAKRENRLRRVKGIKSRWNFYDAYKVVGKYKNGSNKLKHVGIVFGERGLWYKSVSGLGVGVACKSSSHPTREDAAAARAVRGSSNVKRIPTRTTMNKANVIAFRRFSQWHAEKNKRFVVSYNRLHAANVSPCKFSNEAPGETSPTSREETISRIPSRADLESIAIDPPSEWLKEQSWD